MARPEDEAAATPRDPPAPFPWRAALTAVWVAGAAGYWLLVAARVARFRRALRAATPAPAGVVALAQQTAGRLGLRRVPAVLFVGAAVSPLVWAGFGRPRLVLPARLWGSLTGDQREAVLAHELAHLRRGDHWVRRLELVVLALYWWFPVAWLACRRLRDAEEACCDAWVVWALPGRAAAYAEALVETVAFVSRPGWVPLASGGAARAEALKRRLTMILSNTPARKGRRAVAVGLVAAGLLVLPLRPGFADDPKPAGEPPAGDPDHVLVLKPPAAGDPADVLVFKYPDDPKPKKPAGDQLKRADLRFSSTHEPLAGTPDLVAALKDELELLEAQGQTKAAQVKAAEVAVKSTARQMDYYKKLGGGAIAQSEIANIQAMLEKAEAELDVRRAEYNEHAVKVRQAKRRLDDVARGGGRPANPAPKKVADPLVGEAPAKRPAEADRRKFEEAMRQLSDQMAKGEAVLKDLANKRQQLADQLKEITRQQEDVDAKMEKLRAMMKDLQKRFPDAAGPKK